MRVCTVQFLSATTFTKGRTHVTNSVNPCHSSSLLVYSVLGSWSPAGREGTMCSPRMRSRMVGYRPLTRNRTKFHKANNFRVASIKEEIFFSVQWLTPMTLAKLRFIKSSLSRYHLLATYRRMKAMTLHLPLYVNLRPSMDCGNVAPLARSDWCIKRHCKAAFTSGLKRAIPSVKQYLQHCRHCLKKLSVSSSCRWMASNCNTRRATSILKAVTSITITNRDTALRSYRSFVLFHSCHFEAFILLY